jgi:peptide deformylase
MNEIRMEFGGFFARVIQHEIDHLHGIMFVDHLDEDEKKKVQSALRRIKKNKIIPDYPVFAEQKKIFGF